MCGIRFLDAWEIRKNIFYVKVESELKITYGDYDSKYFKYTDEEQSLKR